MVLVTQHNAAVERDEKLMLFNTLNAVDLCANVLFCIRCKEWLTAPIFTDVGDHVCGRCKTDDDDERNHHLEAALSCYYFPCKYYKQGCGVAVEYLSLVAHEGNCKVMTTAWNDLKCAICEFKSQKCHELVTHYKDEHKVPTIDETNSYLPTNISRLAFATFYSNPYVIQLADRTQESQYIQICTALGTMPQFRITLHCYDCDRTKHVAVDTNMNQLHEHGPQFYICTHPSLKFYLQPKCSNMKIGCLSTGHEEGTDCAFGFVKCCGESFTAQDHCKHIKQKHDPLMGAVIQRSAVVDDEKCHYIRIDENILRLMDNSVSKLYWFAGNWPYTVCAYANGAIIKQFKLLLCESCALPEQWDMLYICRFAS